MSKTNARDRGPLRSHRWCWTAGLLALGASASATAAADGFPASVAAEHFGISYEGRFASEASGAVRMGFPGVTAHLHFQGRALTMHVESPDRVVFFDVSIDGADPTLLQVRHGEGDYQLLQTPVASEHVVTLTRRNESWQGTCTLMGFALDEAGQWLEAVALPKRKLMFIGDSVTCGAMTSYEPSRDMQDSANSNARLSYGMLLARRLGAQCHLVSYGGRGIIRDWQGLRDVGNAPQFYERAMPDDPATRWDHSRYVPDAIGIQLGTNDFNLGAPDKNEFEDAFVAFIKKLRRDAPRALIFVMDSPIVDDDPVRGPRRTVLHGYLADIVARVGSSQVSLAPLRHYPGVPGNGHPTRQDHEAMVAELEPLFRAALKW